MFIREKYSEMLEVLRVLQVTLCDILLAERTDETASCDELTTPWAEVECWVDKIRFFKQMDGWAGDAYTQYKLSNEQIGVMFWDSSLSIMPHRPYNPYYIVPNPRGIIYTEPLSPRNENLNILYDFYESINGPCTGRHDCENKVEWEIVEHPKDLVYLCDYMSSPTSNDQTILYLSNGIAQVNIGNEKIIMCARNQAITYIDEKRDKRTFTFQTLREKICCKGIEKHLITVYELVGLFLLNNDPTFVLASPCFPSPRRRSHA